MVGQLTTCLISVERGRAVDDMSDSVERGMAVDDTSDQCRAG